MELELLWVLAPDLPSNTHVNLTWSSITLGHKMSAQASTSDKMSTWPKDLTKCQPDPKYYHTGPQDVCWQYMWPNVTLDQRCDRMSTWPEVVSHLATRNHCWGVCLTKCHTDPKIWQNVNLTQSNITLGHKMSLLWGYIWPKVNFTQILTKCQPDPK